MLNEENSILAISQPNTRLQPNTKVIAVSRKFQGYWPVLAFVFLSMLVQISVGQEETITSQSWTYWALIGPALLLPFFNFKQILSVLFSRAGVLLLAFLIFAIDWHLLRGDMQAVSQVILVVWITAWVAGNRTAFNVKDLANLYIFLLLIGIFIVYFTNMNVWGLFPGSTREDYGVWRVSFFPNIANTGILSLFMLLILTKDKQTMLRHPIMLGICLYFLIFSFVRAAQIAAVLYVLMRLWFYFSYAKYLDKKRLLFLSALLMAVSAHAFIALAPLLLEYLQGLPFVSRLFLRGMEGLSRQEIFEQAYRPWLWLQHFQLFTSSPGLMGLGTFEFDQLVKYTLLREHINTGSESLPTRLLASFGLPFLLFMGFILVNLKKRAEAADHWACACFPAVMLLMMNWGSVFHPTNAFFVLFFFILLHGSNGFLGKYAYSS